ncbi:fatty acid cis/trans isomerase [Aestuariicella sp. G3-2]|uniref:fatty acid cis/trans isomerase n=1 Tax=Pseudomaricurvus albidus TaxID=2842452 RepID=UPI001C0DAEE8|nr:fatty acid cis/trans isomerase [Aestuariicella albida]MBU3070442.1 fatty acid cis/trans isomerase [Aestuariicella albida]
MPSKSFFSITLVIILASCAGISSAPLDKLYGHSTPQERQVPSDSQRGQSYTKNIKPIIEHRCTVCHGCYDAPCQLKMSSTTGLNRGGSKELVYDGLRLTESTPNRLFIDHHTTEAWRKAGFHPVINERAQTPAANLEGSLMYKMLELKTQNPIPQEGLLPEDITVNIDREYSCPKVEEFNAYKKENPNWGMPYGLPGLSSVELHKLSYWLTIGAPMPEEPPLPANLKQEVERWESYFNQDSLKAQLTNRYIYEHLFLANLYFDELSTDTFFNLVRSSTPPGQPIQVIPTRRPYEDPQVDRVYYRLQKVTTTRLAKTHMPYALNSERKAKWDAWFYNTDYEVTSLPSYKPEVTGNPFMVFQQLPTKSRYRFMLDEAEFTIMGFIKGPVCRGQIALNVINDRFWVFFSDPDLIDPIESNAFLAEQSEHLRLPTEAGSTILPITNWLKYSSLHEEYLDAQHEAQKAFYSVNDIALNEQTVWDGDGDNNNAALTVFRHIDSASVVKGLVGKEPKTAWIINYPILERIHYLLVAGFDVYGNVGHQLTTRLYMDFLRMESEMNFLTLLPPEEQKKQWDNWYQGASSSARDFVEKSSSAYFDASRINYKTDAPKTELLQLLKDRLQPVLMTSHSLDESGLSKQHIAALEELGTITGTTANLLPQVVFLSIEDANGKLHLFSVLHNNAHTNITSLLKEESNRLPEKDSITVTNGLIGAYPGAFWHIKQNQLDLLVRDAKELKSEQDYQRFMARYGIRRTNPNFWQHSDKIHATDEQNHPIEYGLFDFNRLENR